MEKHQNYNLALLFLQLYTVLGQKCCKDATTDGSGTFSHSSQDLNITDSVSFCLWVRPSHTDSYYILNYMDPDNEPQILVTTRQVWMMSEFISNLSLPDNQSTYLCLTWDRAAGVVLYSNGTQLSDNTEDEVKNSSINFTGLWSIGSDVSSTLTEWQGEGNLSLGQFSESRGFVGSLCGMTIWSDVLSSRYITELYQNQSFEEEEDHKKRSTDSEYVIIKAPVVSWEDFDLLNSTAIDNQYCEQDPAHGIRLGKLDPVASKFVILFLVIIGVIIGFAALFMCSEREIANKRAKKRLKQENNISIDNVSSHSVT